MSPFGEVQAPRPLVSVLIVTHGAWEVTSRALDALARNTDVPHEVIVVDNASPDGTPEELATRANLTCVFNDDNVGFGPAVNQGATLARGPYLLLLNNDAYVEPGWLEPLIAVLEADERVGAAVPMVLNLDGSLQEAGALVGSDGRTIALGRGGDPDDPLYGFARYVDYGSALCLLVRREAFLGAGGFDPSYRIGYCEDVDLCLRLARDGWLTRYEPRSRVLHVGGASSDPLRVAQLVRSNTAILRERWPEVLAKRPDLAEWYRSPHAVLDARDAEAIDRVLVVDEAVPAEDGSGGHERTGRLLAGLVSAWPSARVTLLTRDADPRGDSRWLLDLGVEVACAPGDVSAWLRDRLLHPSVVVVAGAAAADAFGDEIRATQPQALIAYAMEDPLDHAVPATTLRRSEVRMMRSSHALWGSSLRRLAAAAQIAPDVPRFRVPEGGWSADELPGVLAYLGMAVLLPSRRGYPGGTRSTHVA